MTLRKHSSLSQPGKVSRVSTASALALLSLLLNPLFIAPMIGLAALVAQAKPRKAGSLTDAR